MKPDAYTVLDLETRSRCDLNEHGAWAYAEHDSTEGMCAVWRSFVGGEFGPYHVWTEGRFLQNPDPAWVVHDQIGMPDAMLSFLRSGEKIVAHNAEFEAAILHFVYGIKLPAQRFIDTMAMAKYCQLPGGLDEACELMKLGRKDPEGKAAMQKFCMPDKRGLLTEIPDWMYDQLVRYNVRDVEMAGLVMDKLHVFFPKEEQRIWEHMLSINMRGVPVDLGFVRSIDKMRTVGMSTVEIPAGLSRDDLTKVAKLKKTLDSLGYKFDSLNKKEIDKLLKQSSLPSDVRQILMSRKEVARAAFDKIDAVVNFANRDSRIRGAFRYYGTSTGRASGSGAQLQNFAKPPPKIDVEASVRAVESGDPILCKQAGNGSINDCLSACIRPIITASPGRKLIISDYGQIEARGVLWLAEDYEHLEWWNTRDMYCEMATRLFGRPITKADKVERDIGKRTILSCNFQIGPDRFDDDCRENGIYLDQLGLTPESVVYGFRDLFTSLSDKRDGLWISLQRSFLHCAKTGETIHANRLVYTKVGRHIFVRLPSGRHLVFRNVRVVNKDNVGKDGSRWSSENVVATNPDGTDESYYGGKLADNFVQALCTDLTRDAICHCEETGLPIVMHVHDELVAEVEETRADLERERLERIMTTAPAWATGFPIKVESAICSRYTK